MDALTGTVNSSSRFQDAASISNTDMESCRTWSDPVALEVAAAATSKDADRADVRALENRVRAARSGRDYGGEARAEWESDEEHHVRRHGSTHETEEETAAGISSGVVGGTNRFAFYDELSPSKPPQPYSERSEQQQAGGATSSSTTVATRTAETSCGAGVAAAVGGCCSSLSGSSGIAAVPGPMNFTPEELEIILAGGTGDEIFADFVCAPEAGGAKKMNGDEKHSTKKASPDGTVKWRKTFADDPDDAVVLGSPVKTAAGGSPSPSSPGARRLPAAKKPVVASRYMSKAGSKPKQAKPKAAEGEAMPEELPMEESAGTRVKKVLQPAPRVEGPEHRAILEFGRQLWQYTLGQSRVDRLASPTSADGTVSADVFESKVLNNSEKRSPNFLEALKTFCRSLKQMGCLVYDGVHFDVMYEREFYERSPLKEFKHDDTLQRSALKSQRAELHHFFDVNGLRRIFKLQNEEKMSDDFLAYAIAFRRNADPRLLFFKRVRNRYAEVYLVPETVVDLADREFNNPSSFVMKAVGTGSVAVGKKKAAPPGAGRVRGTRGTGAAGRLLPLQSGADVLLPAEAEGKKHQSGGGAEAKNVVIPGDHVDESTASQDSPGNKGRAAFRRLMSSGAVLKSVQKPRTSLADQVSLEATAPGQPLDERVVMKKPGPGIAFQHPLVVKLFEQVQAAKASASAVRKTWKNSNRRTKPVREHLQTNQGVRGRAWIDQEDDTVIWRSTGYYPHEAVVPPDGGSGQKVSASVGNTPLVGQRPTNLDRSAGGDQKKSSQSPARAASPDRVPRTPLVDARGRVLYSPIVLPNPKRSASPPSAEQKLKRHLEDERGAPKTSSGLPPSGAGDGQLSASVADDLSATKGGVAAQPGSGKAAAAKSQASKPRYQTFDEQNRKGKMLGYQRRAPTFARLEMHETIEDRIALGRARASLAKLEKKARSGDPRSSSSQPGSRAGSRTGSKASDVGSRIGAAVSSKSPAGPSSAVGSRDGSPTAVQTRKAAAPKFVRSAADGKKSAENDEIDALGPARTVTGGHKRRGSVRPGGAALFPHAEAEGEAVTFDLDVEGGKDEDVDQLLSTVKRDDIALSKAGTGTPPLPPQTSSQAADLPTSLSLSSSQKKVAPTSPERKSRLPSSLRWAATIDRLEYHSEIDTRIAEGRGRAAGRASAWKEIIDEPAPRRSLSPKHEKHKERMSIRSTITTTAVEEFVKQVARGRGGGGAETTTDARDEDAEKWIKTSFSPQLGDENVGIMIKLAEDVDGTGETASLRAGSSSPTRHRRKITMEHRCAPPEVRRMLHSAIDDHIEQVRLRKQKHALERAQLARGERVEHFEEHKQLREGQRKAIEAKQDERAREEAARDRIRGRIEPSEEKEKHSPAPLQVDGEERQPDDDDHDALQNFQGPRVGPLQQPSPASRSSQPKLMLVPPRLENLESLPRGEQLQEPAVASTDDMENVVAKIKYTKPHLHVDLGQVVSPTLAIPDLKESLARSPSPPPPARVALPFSLLPVQQPQKGTRPQGAAAGLALLQRSMWQGEGRGRLGADAVARAKLQHDLQPWASLGARSRTPASQRSTPSSHCSRGLSLVPRRPLGLFELRKMATHAAMHPGAMNLRVVDATQPMRHAQATPSESLLSSTWSPTPTNKPSTPIISSNSKQPVVPRTMLSRVVEPFVEASEVRTLAAARWRIIPVSQWGVEEVHAYATALLTEECGKFLQENCVTGTVLLSLQPEDEALTGFPKKYKDELLGQVRAFRRMEREKDANTIARKAALLDAERLNAERD